MCQGPWVNCLIWTSRQINEESWPSPALYPLQSPTRFISRFHPILEEGVQLCRLITLDYQWTHAYPYRLEDVGGAARAYGFANVMRMSIFDRAKNADSYCERLRPDTLSNSGTHANISSLRSTPRSVRSNSEHVH